MNQANFDEIPDDLLISGSDDRVKYLCANEKEKIYLKSAEVEGVDEINWCDYYKIQLRS